VTRDDVSILACPRCLASLTPEDESGEGGRLACTGCGHVWPIAGGVPVFVDEDRVGGVDRLMRFIYDHFAILHDPAVRYLLPIFQGSSAETLRDGYMRRLALDELRPTPGRVPRILEVGVGDGANLPLLERDLPPDLDVEIWGLDLSAGMLALCRRRLATHGGRPVRLLLGDGHMLPFRDATFDRVLHVGGIAGFHDPRRGLAEIARVARPGTPIVVVDEQLDPRERHGLYHRLVFRAITFYDPAPSCPRHLLPPGAVDVVEEQLSRFYYCLTFRSATPDTPS
jgi:ubiquinone/menaquinone biosynthesis C-methylase UbiE/uncharacterized protein YbaR (Trm112 family)